MAVLWSIIRERNRRYDYFTKIRSGDEGVVSKQEGLKVFFKRYHEDPLRGDPFHTPERYFFKEMEAMAEDRKSVV